jgi:hypothetical protein
MHTGGGEKLGCKNAILDYPRFSHSPEELLNKNLPKITRISPAGL